MKRTFIFTSYCLLFVIYYSFAQVPADSLPGTYAGQYWYANPSSNPWVITADTAYVTNIDSLNCVLQAYTSTFTITGTPPAATYYTDYYSCNSIAPINSYSKFYNVDSLRIIFDNIPQPFPNPPISMRFYGKRISNKTAGVKEFININQILIFPNPTSGVSNLKIREFENLKMNSIGIYNVYGKKIYSAADFQINSSSNLQINLSEVPNGVYFLHIISEEGRAVKKVIVSR